MMNNNNTNILKTNSPATAVADDKIAVVIFTRARRIALGIRSPPRASLRGFSHDYCVRPTLFSARSFRCSWYARNSIIIRPSGVGHRRARRGVSKRPDTGFGQLEPTGNACNTIGRVRNKK
jgi:hypothetical protein